MTAKHETIKLTADNRVVALRRITEIQQTVGTIFNIIKDGTPLNAELGENALKVAEYYLGDLGKALGIETEGEAERIERAADLRTANLRIHELEAQLGDAQSPQVTQLGLKRLDDQLNRWWDFEGFGHISSISFEKYGCRVNFSCHLYGDFALVDSKTPVSDKERTRLWHEDLRQRGFVLTEEGREVALVDCDASRKALCDLLRTRIPSSSVFKFENVHKQKSEDFLMRGVEVYIHKIEDILTLPLPDTGQSAESLKE
jgi:hypothetical protein